MGVYSVWASAVRIELSSGRCLIQHCGDKPTAVHIQFTPEVAESARQPFAELGCTLHEVARFGDGRYCNKVGQIENLSGYDFRCAVLLDTDMIAVGDLRSISVMTNCWER
jgi:hypothetical protein